jgi:hypothetical protein
MENLYKIIKVSKSSRFKDGLTIQEKFIKKKFFPLENFNL